MKFFTKNRTLVLIQISALLSWIGIFITAPQYSSESAMGFLLSVVFFSLGVLILGRAKPIKTLLTHFTALFLGKMFLLAILMVVIKSYGFNLAAMVFSFFGLYVFHLICFVSFIFYNKSDQKELNHV